jgi:prepilin-type processing-associated H-X9-DG protein
MAFSMYADDYNGVIYYDVSAVHFTDNGTPLQQYLGTSSNSFTRLQTMRMCPARLGQVPFGMKGYEIPIGQYHKGLLYANAAASGSSYFRGVNYWPDLKSVAQPGQYLLMTEVFNTLNCGQLVSKVSSPAAGINADPLPSIARHGGAVNCLFGDFHVELVSSNNLAPHDVNCSSPGNTWFDLN